MMVPRERSRRHGAARGKQGGTAVYAAPDGAALLFPLEFSSRRAAGRPAAAAQGEGECARDGPGIGPG